jgi:hypothetical protein
MEGVIIIAAVLFAILWMLSKKSQINKGYDEYEISKGDHYSTKNDSPFKWKFGFAPKTLRFEAIFGQGCNYEDNNSGDINKLYGISYGLDNHYRSVRIGWKYNANLKVIELYTYAYSKGKRIMNHLMNIKQFEPVFFTIWKLKSANDVRLSVSDSEKTERRIDIIKGIDSETIRLKQFPFFGGNKPAPRDMRIFIREY